MSFLRSSPLTQSGCGAEGTTMGIVADNGRDSFVPVTSPEPDQIHPGAQDFSTRLVASGDGAAEVLVMGEVDVATAPQMRDILYSLLADGHHTLTIDLAPMTFIDSTGLGVLVGVLKRAREAGGNVILKSPRRSVRKVLEISGLSKIVDIVDD